MATDPVFYSTMLVGQGLVPATFDTSLTAPTNVTTIVTAGSSGSVVDEIVAQGVGTTVASVLNIFIYDGATYHLVDQITITAVTSSTTATAFRASRSYANLRIPSGSSLRVSQTVSGNQSMLKVTAFAGSI